MKKTKKVEKKSAPKTRRKRAQFREGFRSRCCFSFGRGVRSLSHARDIADDLSAGFFVCEAIKNLAHCIEMLSKAVLKNHSPYLLLDSLDEFNTRSHQLLATYKELEQSRKVKYCVGRVAFCRALKIFKAVISEEEVSLLLNLIDERNVIEHRDDLHIVSIEVKIEELARLLSIIISIYNVEFRDADLALECEKIADNDDSFETLKDALKSILEKYSEDMKQKEKEKLKLEKKGFKFIKCKKCFYVMGQLSLDGNSSHCLWCHFEVEKAKCIVPSCNEEFWVAKGKKVEKCRTHKLADRVLANSPFKNSFYVPLSIPELVESDLPSLNINDDSDPSED